MLEPQHVDGNVSLLELLILNTLVVKSAPTTLFEFGTFDGRTTLNFAANAPGNATTFTLDLPQAEAKTTKYELDQWDLKFAEKEISGSRFLNSPWRKQIVQLFGDSATFDFNPFKGKVDFIFIDGSHSYDYVKTDSANALRLASRPSTVVWHDYQPFWSGVVDCLEELNQNHPEFSGLRHVEGTSLVVLSLT